MTRTTIRASFPVNRRQERCAERGPSHQEPRPTAGSCRAALMLALAHHVEREIDAGAIPDYATAARALGLTRARLTQVMSLLMLSPEVQERILMGDPQATERRLRHVVATQEWNDQLSAFETTVNQAK